MSKETQDMEHLYTAL